ncbi:O-methyltransferase family protein [Salinisphaera sp. PC39]|uniref:class I SAM-dependent methyltransferase n=1 Tax=Salinisphaera sp. PC39 TaxID=1304156 RepID=UPI003342031F
MTTETLGLPETVLTYLRDVSLREPDLLRELRAETAKRADARMQIAPEQGQFLALLLQLIGARRTIEVGVYTGYSALVTALALPADGYVLACDIDPDTTDTAQRYWRRAAVADRIDLRLAPALETLDAEVRAGNLGRYDFAFIDADKGGYVDYYERCLALLRPGGLIAVDNTLWHGRVADPDDTDDDTLAIRAFNDHAAGDERVDLSLVPIADGVTLARKR